MARIDFKLDNMPEIGSRMLLQRYASREDRSLVTLQTYALVAWDPHTDRRHRKTGVMTWQSKCNECGARFRFKTGLFSKGFYRRCEECRNARVYDPKEGWNPGAMRNQYRLLAPGEVDPASLF